MFDSGNHEVAWELLEIWIKHKISVWTLEYYPDSKD